MVRTLAVSDAGLLGAALVYVLQLGGLFQWIVRKSSEVGLNISLFIALAANGSGLGHARIFEPGSNTQN